MILDIITITISLVALVFSTLQFFFEKSRMRKEATINAFNQLEENENIKKLFSSTKEQLDLYINNKKCNISDTDREWEDISCALSLIEHFAVGINNKIYDYKILNAMAGNHITNIFYLCKEIIDFKKQGEGKENNYCEFSKMINKIVEYRKRKNQALPKQVSNYFNEK